MSSTTPSPTPHPPTIHLPHAPTHSSSNQPSPPPTTLLALTILSSIINSEFLITLPITFRVLFYDFVSLLTPITYHSHIIVAENAKKLISQIHELDTRWVSSPSDLPSDATPPQEETQINVNEEEMIQQDKENLQRILSNLRDNQLPIRAMGLVELRMMVIHKRPFVLKNFNRILDIFLNHFEEEEEFAYEAAVSGCFLIYF
jgi:hypothetical protein